MTRQASHLGPARRQAAASATIAAVLCASLALASPGEAATSPVPGGVDRSTVVGKVLVGYQGWFRCPGDGSPSKGWSHWTRGDAEPSASTISVYQYPDVTGLDPASLCPTKNLTIQGRPAYLFSSFPKETAERHFEWMKEYGIDGALVQRFSEDAAASEKLGDHVLRNIRSAAEGNGRVFAVEYDLSHHNLTPEQVVAAVEADWLYLVDTLEITASPSYQMQDGRPLVSLYGVGFMGDAGIKDPALASSLISWFHDVGKATVMGGVSTGWRTPGQNGSAPGDGWNGTYAQLDIVQPWTVGVYGDLSGVDAFKRYNLIPDLARTRANHQLYMPVILPGEGRVDQGGGQFFWEQIGNATGVGVSMVKVAMWDEVNEGTALFKVASLHSQAPDQGKWVTLDHDGFTLPSDWYMRLAYELHRTLDGTIPSSNALPKSPWVTTAQNCGVIRAAATLGTGQSIASCDHRFTMTLKPDGDLVILMGDKQVWSNGAAGRQGTMVTMRSDGDLVEYTAQGQAIWSTDTANHRGAFLRLQDDGVATLVDATGVLARTR